MIAQPPRK
jgi:hypothetical protein